MTKEEHELMQQVLRDHPRGQFYDGPIRARECPSARLVRQILTDNKESVLETISENIKKEIEYESCVL